MNGRFPPAKLHEGQPFDIAASYIQCLADRDGAEIHVVSDHLGECRVLAHSRAEAQRALMEWFTENESDLYEE